MVAGATVGCRTYDREVVGSTSDYVTYYQVVTT